MTAPAVTVTKRDAMCDGLIRLAAWLRTADPAVPEPWVGLPMTINFHDFDEFRRVLRDLGWNAVRDDHRVNDNYLWRATEVLTFGPVKVQLQGFEPVPVDAQPLRTLFADVS